MSDNAPRGAGRLTTKEKGAAPTQITAEQLLREAAALQSHESRAPARRLVDEDELNEYRVRKRKAFEDSLRRKRQAISIWLSYATWEADQQDFRRARSVFERTLEIDYQRVDVWNKYLDMECDHQFLNSARNLFDRVVALLPRIDHFWLRYTAFEEALHNYAGCRAVFERWMKWNPEDRAWLAYVKFEERCKEIDRARAILERFLTVHPRVSSFLKFAKWEEGQGNWLRARAGYEKAMDVLPPEELTENFFLKFAHFEEARREVHRAKTIYLEGLKRLGNAAAALQSAYVSFEKRLGEKEEVEAVVMDKRRQHYELLLKKTEYYDYDVWLNLIRLEEEVGNIERIRATYERALSYEPQIKTKAHYKRYFYIYLNLAVFEELTAKDIERADTVWNKLAEKIPHTIFSFAKFWKLWAHFEIRRGRLQEARLIFGRAIATYPVPKIFEAYCDLELKLGQIERCRKICAKFIEKQPQNPKAWLSLIDLELLTREDERARKLFEMAIETQQVENVEVLWKAYIDVEANLKQFARARDLFERLIRQTAHWKVFQAKAEFELKTVADIDSARKTLERGIEHCKEMELDAERAALIDAWVKMEKEFGSLDKYEEVTKMIPRKIKKRRTITLEDGNTTSVEEYTAYIFADQAGSTSSLAILEAAKRWKKRKMEQEVAA